MDGCPRQNPKVALRAIEKVGAKVFRIPDLNPIENFFHLVSMKLTSDAIEKQITRESIHDFSWRINAVVKANGQRIKYSEKIYSKLYYKDKSYSNINI